MCCCHLADLISSHDVTTGLIFDHYINVWPWYLDQFVSLDKPEQLISLEQTDTVALMLFHLWRRFITFGGRSAHLAYHVHKSGRKTSIIIWYYRSWAGHVDIWWIDSRDSIFLQQNVHYVCMLCWCYVICLVFIGENTSKPPSVFLERCWGNSWM